MYVKSICFGILRMRTSRKSFYYQQKTWSLAHSFSLLEVRSRIDGMNSRVQVQSIYSISGETEVQIESCCFLEYSLSLQSLKVKNRLTFIILHTSFTDGNLSWCFLSIDCIFSCLLLHWNACLVFIVIIFWIILSIDQVNFYCEAIKLTLLRRFFRAFLYFSSLIYAFLSYDFSRPHYASWDIS